MGVALVVKTVMIVLVVANCGAVPTASTSQEEVSKAQVNMKCSVCQSVALLVAGK